MRWRALTPPVPPALRGSPLIVSYLSLTPPLWAKYLKTGRWWDVPLLIYWAVQWNKPVQPCLPRLAHCGVNSPPSLRRGISTGITVIGYCCGVMLDYHFRSCYFALLHNTQPLGSTGLHRNTDSAREMNYITYNAGTEIIFVCSLVNRECCWNIDYLSIWKTIELKYYSFSILLTLWCHVSGISLIVGLQHKLLILDSLAILISGGMPQNNTNLGLTRASSSKEVKRFSSRNWFYISGDTGQVFLSRVF